MRKDISPEMYNYNKFPGPQFVAVSDRVKSDDIELLILANEKDAFNATVFSQRFSEILLKYDYIVGDLGNEQLRLKGFYKDDRDVKKANRISRLDDYLKEYCNFGCAYFVLENKQDIINHKNVRLVRKNLTVQEINILPAKNVKKTKVVQTVIKNMNSKKKFNRQKQFVIRRKEK